MITDVKAVLGAEYLLYLYMNAYNWLEKQNLYFFVIILCVRYDIHCVGARCSCSFRFHIVYIKLCLNLSCCLYWYG